MESVAARAGVGKATIYRRWATKESLIGDALATLNETMPSIPAEAPTRDMLVEVLEHIRTRGDDSVISRLLPRLVACKVSRPELLACYQKRVVEERRELVRRIIAIGQDRGDLRPDLDAELAVTLLVGPMIYSVLLRPHPPSREESEAMVDTLLTGFAT